MTPVLAAYNHHDLPPLLKQHILKQFLCLMYGRDCRVEMEIPIVAGSRCNSNPNWLTKYSQYVDNGCSRKVAHEKHSKEMDRQVIFSQIKRRLTQVLDGRD